MTVIRIPICTPAVTNLLQECALKTDDLTAQVHLLGVEESSQLFGVVGLECFGQEGLLRSLAVLPAYRGQGWAHVLVRAVELLALELEIKRLFLLTDTAAGFFKCSSYVQMNREAAPECIKTTAQFSGLCPASAVLMYKDIAHVVR